MQRSDDMLHPRGDRSIVSAQDPVALATELMTRFAERTGLQGGAPPRRYLWTDAFAVCNFLGLGRVDLARDLVAQVHAVLGRHRADDVRRGWLSGLDDATAAAHPTLGGLRIGKPMPERGPRDPLIEDLEWERDGQYFHYLTQWMHALAQLAHATGDPAPRRWACELAEVAHLRFMRGGRMCWKMSIDLSRALVPSMGQHDPLDGLVTCLELDCEAVVGDLADDYRELIDLSSLATTDPLGLGGLLIAAARMSQLGRRHALASRDHAILDATIAAAERGLATWARAELRRPVEHRLAFRELGLAIGLRGVPYLEPRAIARLEPFAPVGLEIEACWRRAEHRQGRAWTAHADIDDVMLATALAPDGYLTSRTDAPAAS